jgi:hypothetical protein
MAGVDPSAVVSAVGNIVAGFGAFQESRAKAAQLRAAAKQARGDASIQAGQFADEAERAAATAAVQGAASGGGTDGSFGAVLEDLQRTGQFNVRSAIYAGEAEARNRLYEAKVAKQEGNFAFLSSALQATSSIGGSYMQRAEQRKQADYRKLAYTKGYGR